MKLLPKSLHKGFTLIELLVVIAVLGVLSVILLVAIDPVEKIKQAADAGGKQDVSSVTNALASFVTSNTVAPTPATNPTLPTVCAGAADWKACLTTNTSELKSVPTNAQYSVNAAGDAYSVSYLLTSKTEIKKAACAAGVPTAWFSYQSSTTGKTGYACTANASTLPTP